MDDGRSQIAIEWMKIAEEIASGNKKTLLRLLSQASTSALMDAYELCTEVSGLPAGSDSESEVLVALRKELATRGFEPRLDDDLDARANSRPQLRH